jgi:hypothetical protein
MKTFVFVFSQSIFKLLCLWDKLNNPGHTSKKTYFKSATEISYLKTVKLSGYETKYEIHFVGEIPRNWPLNKMAGLLIVITLCNKELSHCF